LLSLYQEAAQGDSSVRDALIALKSDVFIIKEESLSDDEKGALDGALRLVEYYTKNNDKEFNERFDKFLTEQDVSTTPTAPQGGFWKNLASRVMTGLGSLGRSFLKGFYGSEGKTANNITKPGWKDVKVNTDLSKITADTVFNPQQLKEIGLDDDTINSLQRSLIAGVNVTDGNNNLVSVKNKNGRYIAKPELTYRPAVAQAQTAQAGQQTTTTTATSAQSDQQTTATTAASAGPGQQTTASPVQNTIFKAKPIEPPSTNVYSTPGRAPMPGYRTAQETFQKAVNKVLREFDEKE
jgi:hypothetical protein